ncbi:Hypothetical_protein [Hexamita inflata]|uniref:Hypothetical_protein n=1 Tax=Hexamita inflata TaxID=28002 RepID=A0ABP1IK19_9EUKA
MYQTSSKPKKVITHQCQTKMVINVIPIIIGKNCTIHTKSRKFLEELDLIIENVYEEICNLLAVYYASCAQQEEEPWDLTKMWEQRYFTILLYGQHLYEFLYEHN